MHSFLHEVNIALCLIKSMSIIKNSFEKFPNDISETYSEYPYLLREETNVQGSDIH